MRAEWPCHWHLRVLTSSDTLLFPRSSLQFHSGTSIQASSAIGGNVRKVQEKKHHWVLMTTAEFPLESVHGRAINWGQEHLEVGVLFSLPVRTRLARHPSQRPRDCLMKPVWISRALCLGRSPRPVKWLGNMPIFGKVSSAYYGFILFLCLISISLLKYH